MNSEYLEQLRNCCRDEAAFEQLQQLLNTHLPLPPTQGGAPLACGITNREQRILRVIGRLGEFITDRIGQSLNMAETLQATIHEVRLLLESDRVVVYRFNPDWSGEFISESVVPGWPSLLPQQYEDTYLRQQASQCSLQQLTHHPPQETYLQMTSGETWRDRGCFVVEDVDQQLFPSCYLELLQHYHIRAYATMPIFAGDRLWGLLATYQHRGCRPWEEAEVNLLILIAHQIGSAIQLAASMREAQHQAEQRRVLFNIVSRMRQSLDITTILATTTAEVRSLLGVDRVAVYRFWPDWSGSFVAESVAPGWVKLVNPQTPQIWEDTHLQETQGGRYQNNDTLAVPDIYTAGHFPCHVELLEQFQARAYTIVPIFCGDRLWGLLAAYQNDSPRHWQTEEVELLTQVAVQLGVVLQQAELFVDLRQSEARLRRLVEANILGITITDAQGVIIEANEAFLSLVGYTQEALCSGQLTWQMLTPPEFHKQDQAALEQIRQTGVASPWEKEYLHKEGRRVPILIGCVALEGRADTALSVILDLSARKQAEQLVHQLNQTLQQRNLELEATNKELEAFSYSVSHDLRAPLRSIDGFSQALLEDCIDQIDPLGQNYLQRIRQATQRMGRLIDDLLSLSRVTRSEMRVDTVNLSVLAQAITIELHQMAPERQVQFQVQAGLITQGDPQLLRVLLSNLLENAWKFTSKHPQAAIEFGATLTQNGKKVYFVRDDGAGFEMAYASKLFGAFQRLHPMAEFPGTGVGLATVQRIVHRHGGQIWAEAAIEQGATFYFTLHPETRVP